MSVVSISSASDLINHNYGGQTHHNFQKSNEQVSSNPQLDDHIIEAFGEKFSKMHDKGKKISGSIKGRSLQGDILSTENNQRSTEGREHLDEGRSLGGQLLRSDTLNEIHSGLSTIGKVIKIVTTVLTLFGVNENIDR